MIIFLFNFQTLESKIILKDDHCNTLLKTLSPPQKGRLLNFHRLYVAVPGQWIAMLFIQQATGQDTDLAMISSNTLRPSLLSTNLLQTYLNRLYLYLVRLYPLHFRQTQFSSCSDSFPPIEKAETFWIHHVKTSYTYETTTEITR